ncbi:unnamed protein product [Orchesella dallaii]|uniref:Peptidase C19 ubiquitin carboxyl-terminal hydrolase domain-containing protein n=1 Tax=Orchesella dallaii TaxID=48710 RepID=A0ABP1RH21_9HEXA
MISWVPNPPQENNDDSQTWNSRPISRLQILLDRFGTGIYKECVANGFSIDDEVMWVVDGNAYRQTSSYIGKIQFIGKRECDRDENCIYAFVLFNQNTSHLPGFFCLESGYFKNMVNVNDLKNLNSEEESNLMDVQPVDAELVNGYHSMQFKTQCDCTTLSNRFENLRISQTTVNTSKNTWVKEIDFNELQNLIGIEIDRPFGIQGRDNSCYMDASLFCLFACNHAIDEYIRIKTESVHEASYFFKTTLKEIIKRLRTQFFVEYSETMKLRELLAQSYDKRFRNAFMDAEDFILTLLEAIPTPHMFEYDDGYSDYVYQIMLPAEWNIKNRVECETVQNLVYNSFIASDIKLKDNPDRLFILKLPVSNGQLIPCKFVVPDLKLDLTPILIDRHGIKSQCTASLSAVICFQHSHYVAFSRTNQNESSSWIFMDSNPLTGSPNIMILQYMETILNGLLNQHYKSEIFNSKHIPHIDLFYAEKLLRDAYICIYDTSI